MDNKKVSIVLPTYNGEKFIKYAIDSVINQTYSNWELIIVNDCSIDSTPEIIQEYAEKDSRIKIIHNEINKKVPASLNIGFKNATGDYYTWISDDNMFKNNAIQFMVEYLNNHVETTLISSNFDYISDDGAYEKQFSNILPSRNMLQLANFCNVGACFMYRKEIVNKIGGYDEKMFCAEDYDYWCRIAINGKISYCNENLYIYRNSLHSLTNTKKDIMDARTLDIRLKYMEQLFDMHKLNKYQKITKLFKYYKDDNNKIWLKIAKNTDKKIYLIFSLKNKLKQFARNIFSITNLPNSFPKTKVINIIGFKTKIQFKKAFRELTVRRYGDDRGYLTTIENNEIPFDIKRVYYLSEVSKDKDRAHHAHKRSQRVLSAIQGSVKVKLYDAKNSIQEEFVLDNPSKAIYFDKKVWCELSDFKDNTIVLALASENYDEKEYIRNYDEYVNYVKKGKNK